MAFSADSTGVNNGSYFGFEFTLPQSALALLSVEWDATVSYRSGSAGAPRAIIDASTQVEIYDSHFVDQWQRGIFTLPFDRRITRLGQSARRAARRVIAHIERGGGEDDSVVALDISRVNNASQQLNEIVYSAACEQIAEGRLVGLVGGDHSTPYGLIRALGEHHGQIGILHIDAHTDLRDGYEGFRFSHASIMRRALECDGVVRLVQVAVRDYSLCELTYAHSDPRVVQFTDADLFDCRARGENWASLCERIVSELPHKVYISFDIDGLQRSYCPHTGTPVCGGLSYNEALFLLLEVARSGRVVVGFDLNEVVADPKDEWDAIVGARLLYKLSNLTLSTNKTTND